MMNPFKQLGELNDLRKQAQQLQNALKEIVVTRTKGRATIEMSADMKVRSVKYNEEEISDLREVMNEAIEDAQKKAASKMQQMGGLGNLLGQKG